MELMLACSIPFVMVKAYHTFLGSNAGVIVEDLKSNEPGWRSLVEGSHIDLFVSKQGSEYEKISLLVKNGQSGDESSQDVPILDVPTNAQIGSELVSTMSEKELKEALSITFRLKIDEASYLNPDEYEKKISTDLSESYPNIKTDRTEIKIPLLSSESIDLNKSEEIIREVVQFPVSSEKARRLQVRVINRVAGKEPIEVGAEIAALGFEVIEVGNASEFDNGETTMAVPKSMIEGERVDEFLSTEIERLATSMQVDFLVDDIADESFSVTVLVGEDFNITE